MVSRLGVLLCAAAAVVSAQTAVTKVIEVSVSRSVPLKAEEAGFTLTVFTKTTAGFDEVLAAVASLGITAQDFLNVDTGYSYLDDDEGLNYSFSLTTPFDKMKDTMTLLDAKRRSLTAERGMNLTYSLDGVSATKTSTDQARDRLFPELMADARRQAELMATAAGVRVGAVAGLSQESSATYLVLGRPGYGGAMASASLTVRFAIE